MIGKIIRKKITFKYLINDAFFIAPNFIRIFITSSIFRCTEKKRERKIFYRERESYAVLTF